MAATVFFNESILYAILRKVPFVERAATCDALHDVCASNKALKFIKDEVELAAIRNIRSALKNTWRTSWTRKHDQEMTMPYIGIKTAHKFVYDCPHHWEFDENSHNTHHLATWYKFRDMLEKYKVVIHNDIYDKGDEIITKLSIVHEVDMWFYVNLEVAIYEDACNDMIQDGNLCLRFKYIPESNTIKWLDDDSTFLFPPSREKLQAIQQTPGPDLMIYENNVVIASGVNPPAFYRYKTIVEKKDIEAFLGV